MATIYSFRYRNTEGLEVSMGTEKPFLITGREGLGAVDNNITTQNQYGLDGASLVSQQLAVREIKLTGEMVGTSLAEMQENRQTLISIFNPQLAGTLYYTVNENTYMIDVLVEVAPDLDKSSTMLSQEFTLQFKALQPYWSDLTRYDQLIPLSGLRKLWQFPFTIGSGMKFSEIVSGQIQTIENDGDVPVGAEFTMVLNSAAKNIRVLSIDTQEFFGFSGTYEAGTTLYVNTKQGQKKATFTTLDGTVNNAMPRRMADSTFIELKKGMNYLQILADEGQDRIVTKMSFNPLVLGV